MRLRYSRCCQISYAIPFSYSEMCKYSDGETKDQLIDSSRKLRVSGFVDDASVMLGGSVEGEGMHVRRGCLCA